MNISPSTKWIGSVPKILLIRPESNPAQIKHASSHGKKLGVAVCGKVWALILICDTQSSPNRACFSLENRRGERWPIPTGDTLLPKAVTSSLFLPLLPSSSYTSVTPKPLGSLCYLWFGPPASPSLSLR